MVAVLPIVLGGIAAALLSVFGLQNSVQNQIGDSNDSVLASANFNKDAQSAQQIESETIPACGTSSQVQLVGFEWAQDANGTYQTVVSYVVVPSGTGSGYSLVRQTCSAGASTTPTSSSVIAHDVTSPTDPTSPTTVTFNPNGFIGANAPWHSTQGLFGVNINVHSAPEVTGDNTSRYSYSLSGLPGASASTGSVSKVVQASNPAGCNLASPGSGTYANLLCFADFTNFQDPSSGCQQMNLAIANSPDYLQFCVSASPVNTVRGQCLPTYGYGLGTPAYNSEAFLGNNGFYTGVAGEPALSQRPQSTGNTPPDCRTFAGAAYDVTTVTFSNVQVTNAVGQPATGWTLVTGDAESTDTNGWLEFQNYTTPWSILPNSPSSLWGNSCYDSSDATINGTPNPYLGVLQWNGPAPPANGDVGSPANGQSTPNLVSPPPNNNGSILSINTSRQLLHRCQRHLVRIECPAEQDRHPHAGRSRTGEPSAPGRHRQPQGRVLPGHLPWSALVRPVSAALHRLVRRWQNRVTMVDAEGGADRGDTLVEVLIALVVLSIAVVALLAGFATSITAAGQQRNLASLDSSTRIAANEAIADVQQQAQQQSGTSSDPFVCPSSFSPTFTNLTSSFQVTYSMTYWNGTSFDSTCRQDAPQQYTLTISSGNYNTQVTTVIYDPAAPNPPNPIGAPKYLQWIQSPGNGTTGTPLSPQPQVAVEDSNYNIVTSDFSSVTLQVVSGPGTVSNTCSGVESYGIVQFSNCSLSAPGNYTLQAVDGNGSVSQTPVASVTVAPAPAAKLSFTTNPQTVNASASANAGPITVQLQDAFGNAVNTTSAMTISLTSSSPGSYVLGAQNATTPIGPNTVTIPVNQSSVTFYYGDTKAGTPTLKASASGVASDTLQETIKALTTVSKLGFTTSAFTTGASQPASATTPFTVALEDTFGNPTTKSTSTTVTLVSTSAGAKFAASSGGGSVTTVPIPANTTSVTAYYGDSNSPGNPTITASVSGQPTWTATQMETITAAPTKLVFTTPPVTGPAYTDANLGPITVTEETSNNTPTTVGETVSLSSTSAGTYIFSTTQGATTPTGASTVTIPAGQSSVTFYYGDTHAGLIDHYSSSPRTHLSNAT